MEMEAAGLFRKWWKEMITDPTRCLNYQREQRDKIAPLTFGQLSGAFVVLAVGFTLALLVLILESIYHRVLITVVIL